MSQERIIELEHEVSDLRREVLLLRQANEELLKRAQSRQFIWRWAPQHRSQPVAHKGLIVMGIDAKAAGIDVL